MKKQEIKQLPTKTQEELKVQLREIKVSLQAASLEHAQRKLTNTTSLRGLKDDIARLQTVIRQKTFQDTVKTDGKEEGK